MNKILFTLKSTFTLSIILFTFSQQSFAQEIKEKIPDYLACPCPHLIAHRGASGNYPDSTQLAFEKALEFSTDILEFDVHLSKDGEVVISHDPDLLRITGKELVIADLAWEDIKQLDAAYTFTNKKGAFPFRDKGLRILNLHDFISLFPNSRFNVELKEDSKKLADAVSTFIKEHKLQARVVVASKHESALEHFRKNNPDVLTSGHVMDIIKAYLSWFLNQDISDHPYDLLQLPYKLVNKSLVEYFHSHGKQVHVWTVNDAADIKNMLEAGVDGVMTDYPETALKIFRDSGYKRNRY